ncbi:MAG: DUF2812 domain-containing protein [Ruminococcus sp.]|nr:DUF2812 domain-containing protein [Ruminococcus sp.]MCM1382758.1 DUF2812 domain-containing protein [Muribaculaceae bacterium]
MSEKYEYKKRFYDLESEERWLNEMSEKGLALKKINRKAFKDIYVFEPCEKRYVYREDYNIDDALEEATSPYIKFVTETYGCELALISGGRLYFRKEAETGDFPPVYTDLESRIEAEKKIFGKNAGYAQLSFMMTCMCVTNFFNSLSSETVFGRIGLVINPIGIAAGLIAMASFIAMAVPHRKKIKELENRRNEKGGK